MYVPPAEYASTLHNVLVGLESSSLALWKLVGLAGGYLGLLLFTVYLASSEVRLPIVQYAKAPPPVSNAVAAACDFMETNGVWAGRIVKHTIHWCLVRQRKMSAAIGAPRWALVLATAALSCQSGLSLLHKSTNQF
jgi:hypothetical protein